MKVRFIRNTHDENGNYLGPFSEHEIPTDCIHILNPECGMTLDEVLKDIQDYNELYPDCPISDNPERIALSLLRMLERNMIGIQIAPRS